MAKLKTIYSLEEVFTRFLEDGEKQNFIIPTYQRGYKWTSDGEFSHVQTLMRDLYSAYNRGNGSRYYLQFITLKPAGDNFEVIDGQQRLTTLTIFFCVWAHIHGFSSECFVNNKLKYEARMNFIDQFVFSDLNKLLPYSNWSEFLTANSSSVADIDNQDVFYIFHAAKFIQSFIDGLTAKEQEPFYSYICTHVHIIINLLDNDLSSEKIFINVNKGVKLQDEDLVKGLIVTRIPLDNQTQAHRLTENEINEMRCNIGRQWDDLVRWTSRPDIAVYFNGADAEESKGLKWLIDLSYPDVQNEKDAYPVFSYLDNLCRTMNVPASDIFNKIRQTMLKINDLLCDPELNNLLGYLLHSKRGFNISKAWQEIGELQTKSEILSNLKAHCKKLLPWDYDKGEIEELNYYDDKSKLFDLFILLDICKYLPIGDRKARAYDYSKFVLEKWSIEHIFPQSAKDFKALTSLQPEDLLIIRELLPEAVDILNVEDDEAKEKIISLYEKIRSTDTCCSINTDEREILGQVLTKNAPELHRVGNLALLQSGINSRLSNHFFDNKRKVLVRCVSNGMFVPYHTYDVFSKLIISSETGLHTWSKDDITNHEEYINLQLREVVQYLS